MTRKVLANLAGSAALLVTLAASRASAGNAEHTLTFSLSILDADTGLPVEGAKVFVRNGDLELASGATDASGRIVLGALPVRHTSAEGSAKGDLHIEVVHVGYGLQRVRVDDAVERSVIEVRLTPEEEIVVTARAYADVFRPATTLRGLELQESLRGSVSETISGLPGVAVAYNGPGAARPTIRGLAGDRVLMLEDGFRTGDLYWSASDHGVMVEPLTAHRVEVVRGPATLIHGANALGGVVNVVRDDIPARPSDSAQATLGTQVESASRGVAQGGALVVPVGPVSVRLEESVRHSEDVQTPRGELPNTNITALGGSAGLGWHPAWGLVGASARYYQNDYGVPGEFNGRLVPGGHPGGAAVEARRINGRFKMIYRPPRTGDIESVEVAASFTRYLHDEVEGVIEGRRALGASFELDSLQSNFIVRHKLEQGAPWSLRGATGITVSTQDLLAGGNSPGVRSGADFGMAGFAFEQVDIGSFSLHAGLRYEHRHLSPRVTLPIHVRTADRVIEKSVTARRFQLLSGSLAALWELGDGWVVGSTVARSARAPNLQELYSDGPHLADFSFDIGTPSLPAEAGTGVDVFLLVELQPLSFELAGFFNSVDNYVQYTPTLEMVRVFREGVRPRDTPVFEARDLDALFMGAEGTMTLRIGWGLSLESTLSYVRAERRDDSDPLPFIPPLHGQATMRYEIGGFFASVGASGSARQARVPRAVEAGEGMERPQEPTAGYALAHVSAGWLGELLGMTHTVTARAFNITDRVWRDHLSRIKDVAPQMGLNVSLTYQLQY